MKRVVGGAVLLGAALVLIAKPVFGEEKGAEDLKALDAKLTEAFKKRDFQLLGKHMAEDYILVDPRGHLHTKAQYLKYVADGTPKYKEFKETDVKVRTFGDTAVVTGLLETTGKASDKDVTGEYRWTRVYTKKGNDWLCVYEQHTGVVPKEEPKK
jgi:ketosteroid isomerase-like protein